MACPPCIHDQATRISFPGREVMHLMRMPWSIVLAFCAGIALIWAFGRLFLVPRGLIWRLVTSALTGGLCLWGINLLCSRWGYSLSINPLSALCVGTLGLPGLGLVIALSSLI